jgi:eukaryotic-like serine/threonine-protein kinase
MSEPLTSAPYASADLLRRLAAGDEDAATAVFERYAVRLTALARSRLAAKLAARVDPEDIVLSAYRSFFVAARAGRFEVRRGGDLWRLLTEVTLHKLYRSAEHHFAQQRSVERETGAIQVSSLAAHFATQEPTPDEAVAAADELEAVLRQLSERERMALELRLQGYELEEIAERLDCNERTVRRGLNAARRILAASGGRDFVPSAARRVAAGAEHPATASLRDWELETRFEWADIVLMEQIGSGASGRVYRARAKDGGREVAIKFLRKALVGNRSVMERFAREAKTVADLVHPNILAIHGVGRTPGGGVFLVMDLVRGVDLYRLRLQRDIAVDEAVRWIGDAAGAVEFAHRRGIIHCDLKPSNLLLDAGGKVMVADFGLAVQQIESAQRESLLAGTPAFMAPEQVDSCWGPVSPRTDVWGLGGVLYFLLFGKPPHDAEDVPTVLSRVVSKTPVEFPANAGVQFGARLVEIVGRCLAKNPADRFGSAGELSTALTPVIAAK